MIPGIWKGKMNRKRTSWLGESLVGARENGPKPVKDELFLEIS